MQKQTIRVTTWLTACLLALTVARPGHAQSSPDPIASASASANSVAATNASPPKITNAALGFDIEYKVKSANVCVAWPEELQDPARCTSPRVPLIAAFAAKRNPQPISAAILEYDDGLAISLMQKLPLNGPVVTKQHIEDTIHGLVAGIRSSIGLEMTTYGSKLGSDYDRLEINGFEVIRFEARTDVRRGAPGYDRSRMVFYILLGEKGSVLVNTQTDPEHVQRSREDLAAMVNTAHIPKVKLEGVGATGENQSTFYLAALLSLGPIIGAVLVVWRGRGGRKKRARKR